MREHHGRETFRCRGHVPWKGRNQVESDSVSLVWNLSRMLRTWSIGAEKHVRLFRAMTLLVGGTDSEKTSRRPAVACNACPLLTITMGAKCCSFFCTKKKYFLT